MSDSDVLFASGRSVGVIWSAIISGTTVTSSLVATLSTAYKHSCPELSLRVPKMNKNAHEINSIQTTKHKDQKLHTHVTKQWPGIKAFLLFLAQSIPLDHLHINYFSYNHSTRTTA